MKGKIFFTRRCASACSSRVVSRARASYDSSSRLLARDPPSKGPKVNTKVLSKVKYFEDRGAFISSSAEDTSADTFFPNTPCSARSSRGGPIAARCAVFHAPHTRARARPLHRRRFLRGDAHGRAFSSCADEPKANPEGSAEAASGPTSRRAGGPLRRQFPRRHRYGCSRGGESRRVERGERRGGSVHASLEDLHRLPAQAGASVPSTRRSAHSLAARTGFGSTILGRFLGALERPGRLPALTLPS